MLILSFEEFNKEYGTDNEPMGNIRIKDIGKDISLTPVEIIMRDQKPDSIKESNFNIIVSLHSTDGTHWVLVIRRGGGKVYYFDSFIVETPPLFSEEYVDLGSNERIQEDDESYCGANCLYMIYLIDRRFIIEGALDILVIQVKCPKTYDKCFCFICKAKCKLEVEVEGNGDVNVNDNGNDNQGTCFADGNDNYICNGNQETCFADDKQETHNMMMIIILVYLVKGTKSLVPQPNKKINLVHNWL